MRYQIFQIEHGVIIKGRDGAAPSVSSVIATYKQLPAAKRFAIKNASVSIHGLAIFDTKTGLVDWGCYDQVVWDADEYLPGGEDL